MLVLPYQPHDTEAAKPSERETLIQTREDDMKGLESDKLLDNFRVWIYVRDWR